MKSDIFEAPDNAEFGSNVHEVAADSDCRVLRLEDSSGEGFMTMYRVFDGVYLMYNDFHLTNCVSEYRNTETVLCIDHCREGRIEHENPEGGRYYMESGNIRIDRRVNHEGHIHMPLSHYHGISIGFMNSSASESLLRYMPSFSFDINALSEKFCPAGREFLIRESGSLEMIFSQLYHAPKSIRIDYFRLKVAEILLILGTLDPAEYKDDHQYFPVKQTEKIKEIHSLITTDLSREYTVDELSDKFEISSGALRKIFKGVYGSPIYQYMKNYRMNAAASMLVSQKNMTVSDIALSLGYDNASKFSAAFRSIMGTSPQEYRKGQV